MRRAVPLALLAAVLSWGLVATPAAGCSVCFGDPDSQMAVGVNNGILVLLGVVGVIQVGFVALFWSFYSRARKLKQRREQFSVIDGGVTR